MDRWEEQAQAPAPYRLTDYDIQCGLHIEVAFASFQGLDHDAIRWVTFAALVHRVTGGIDDRANNPLRIDGAGFTGFTGGMFETVVDGCRAAAVFYQFADHREVQRAFRSADRLRLARAIEADPPSDVHLIGLASEVQALLGALERDAVANARHRSDPAILAIR